MSDAGRFLTIQDAAAVLGCKKDHVRALIRSGRLRAYDLAAAGKRSMYRIKPEWLDDLLAECAIQPSPQSPRTSRQSARRAAPPKHLRLSR